MTPAATRGFSWRFVASAVQDALLLVIAGVFVYAHGRHVIVDHSLTSVPFAIEQSILVGVLLTRHRSAATSARPVDWLVAAIGGWLPLMFQPLGGAPAWAGFAGAGIQICGLTVVIVGMLTLGKSFGVVAANRGAKVDGIYGRVRHPIYLGHMISSAGFLLANPALVNLALICVVVVCQLGRMSAEERILVDTDLDYASYVQRVRWRLVPWVY